MSERLRLDAHRIPVLNKNNIMLRTTTKVNCLLITLGIWLLLSFETHAQVAIKNNLLYDITTTPNLGVELGVGRRNTMQLVYGLNPWKFSDNKQVKHWVLMPEYRYWLCSKFNGHFFGVHAMGGQFNASNVDLPIPGAFFGGDNLQKEVRDNSYEGTFAGVGLTYGYQWILCRHWNLEAEIGVGYNHVWYDKYKCGVCGPKTADGQTNYVGVTKLGLSLVYLF